RHKSGKVIKERGRVVRAKVGVAFGDIGKMVVKAHCRQTYRSSWRSAISAIKVRLQTENESRRRWKQPGTKIIKIVVDYSVKFDKLRGMGRVSDARQRLMDAVCELIWAGSYGSTTIDQICEKAGVKKGSFYHFFDSKADLAVA